MTQRSWRWIWLSLRGLVSLLIVALAAVTFIPAIDTNTWWVRFLSFPRVEFLCALAVLLLLSLALPDRFRLAGLAASGLAAAALAYQCVLVFPYTPLATVQAVEVGACPAGDTLTLLEANVQMTNEHDRRLFDEIRQRKPDVIIAEETDRWWHQQLEGLHDAYPYHQSHISQNYYGIDLLSRYPLVDPAVKSFAHSRDPAIVTGVTLPSGRTVRVYAVHPRPPTFGQSAAERDAELMDAALEVNGDAAPSIVAGDMNATPWSPVVRQLARLGHLLDPRIGRGWYPTWAAHAVLMRWPLDNVLFTKDFALLGYQVLRPIGSDHQPTFTSLCYGAPQTVRQTAPRPSKADVADARAAIAQGQGKAAPSPQPKPGKQQADDEKG